MRRRSGTRRNECAFPPTVATVSGSAATKLRSKQLTIQRLAMDDILRRASVYNEAQQTELLSGDCVKTWATGRMESAAENSFNSSSREQRQFVPPICSSFRSLSVNSLSAQMISYLCRRRRAAGSWYQVATFASQTGDQNQRPLV